MPRPRAALSRSTLLIAQGPPSRARKATPHHGNGRNPLGTLLNSAVERPYHKRTGCLAVGVGVCGRQFIRAAAGPLKGRVGFRGRPGVDGNCSMACKSHRLARCSTWLRVIPAAAGPSSWATFLRLKVILCIVLTPGPTPSQLWRGIYTNRLGVLPSLFYLAGPAGFEPAAC